MCVQALIRGFACMVLVCVGMQDCVAVVVIVSVYRGCCLGDAINIDPIPETA